MVTFSTVQFIVWCAVVSSKNMREKVNAKRNAKNHSSMKSFWSAPEANIPGCSVNFGLYHSRIVDLQDCVGYFCMDKIK